VNDHIRELLRAVLNKTEGGKLDWEALDPEAFWAKIGSNNLHLTRVSEEGEPIVYSVRVTDRVGLPVTEVEEKQGSTDFALVDQLFRVVRATPSKSDRVIQEMLRALQASA
jgi:hypothetical protein